MTDNIDISRDISTTIFFLILTVFLTSIVYLLKFHDKNLQRPKRTQWHIVVVLGSGGHSAEMVSLLGDIDPARYIHRTYIASSGDNFAYEKASQIEDIIQAKSKRCKLENAMLSNSETGTWDVRIVPRARKIHQSLLTTPISSLWCALKCIKTLNLIAKFSKSASNEYPDVIVANGPATATMIIFAASLIRFFGVAPSWKLKVIYVESWARVRSLSLSGWLVLKFGLCDRFLVQWEALAKNINKKGAQKVEWVGFLVD